MWDVKSYLLIVVDVSAEFGTSTFQGFRNLDCVVLHSEILYYFFAP
jgi:hypothetical protein